jgi:hypothetical protein
MNKKTFNYKITKGHPFSTEKLKPEKIKTPFLQLAALCYTSLHLTLR